MTLKQQLELSLTSLSPFSAGEQSLEVVAGDQTLRCHLVAFDSLACAFTRFSLAAPSLAGASVERAEANRRAARAAADLSARADQPHRNQRAWLRRANALEPAAKRPRPHDLLRAASHPHRRAQPLPLRTRPPANPANQSPPKSPAKSYRAWPATFPPWRVEIAACTPRRSIHALLQVCHCWLVQQRPPQRPASDSS